MAKLIGAVFVVLGCGGFGFLYAVAHRRETAALRQLISAIEFMLCELQYRLTPLPDMCKLAAKIVKGPVGRALHQLGLELECQTQAEVEQCMIKAIQNVPDLPVLTKEILSRLAIALGKFDLAGQIKGLETVNAECKHTLRQISEHQDIRLRNYQTLGICGGAALVILFI